jgi:hypothetical protein
MFMLMFIFMLKMFMFMFMFMFKIDRTGGRERWEYELARTVRIGRTAGTGPG